MSQSQEVRNRALLDAGLEFIRAAQVVAPGQDPFFVAELALRAIRSGASADDGLTTVPADAPVSTPSPASVGGMTSASRGRRWSMRNARPAIL